MKKIISLIIIVIITFSCFSINCYATEEESNIAPITANNLLVNDGIDHLVVDDNTDNDALLAYGASYIPDDYILTDVKLQEQQTCWIYSAMACAEILYAKKYGVKNSFSENHALDVLTDDLKVMNGYESDTEIAGFNSIKREEGGNFEVAMQYMTNWNNPIISGNSISWNSMIDSDLLDNNSDIFNTSAESRINVTDTKYIAKDKDTIKRNILNYGAVYSSMYFDDSVYTVNNGYCYYNNLFSPNNYLNHAITIVGWDDNYSKDNFSDLFLYEKPATDGAWLVRNSNETSANGGYFWLSYCEMSLNTMDFKPSVILNVENASSNKRMLSFDFIKLSSSYLADDTAAMANIYDTSILGENFNKITEVMTYLRTDGCLYKVFIVNANNINELPTNLDDYTPVAEGNYVGEGYLTIKLNNGGYNIEHGKKYAIIIQTIPSEEDNTTGYYYETNSGLGKFEIHENESLVFQEGYNNDNWKDNYSVKNSNGQNSMGNFCIRPVFEKSMDDSNINITPAVISGTSSDANITINSNRNLFCVKTSNNFVLREDRDYYDTESGIAIKQSFLQSLNDNYTEIQLLFNNNILRTVVVNPKSVISDVTLTGKPIIGDTLTATCVGNPEKSQYDVNYQWQSSTNGENWYNISEANSNTYTITDNDIDRYIRVKVTAKQFGNVEYPTEKFSSSTIYKAVILGDVNLDGTVTVADATLLRKYLADIVTLDERQLLAADANRDNYINVNDVRVIQEIAMGI